MEAEVFAPLLLFLIPFDVWPALAPGAFDEGEKTPYACLPTAGALPTMPLFILVGLVTGS